MIDSPGVHSHAGGASNIHVEHGFGKNTALIFWATAFLSALATFAAIGAWRAADIAERETRVFNDNVLRMEARLEAQGVITPDQEH